MKLDFQVGTSKKAHKIMGKLAGRMDDEKGPKNEKAPFEKMSDAYLFGLVLGLSRGQKVESISNRINYANFSSIEGDLDIYSMIKLFGNKEDFSDRDTIRNAIEAYATWGLLHIDQNYSYGDDDYRLADLFRNH